MKGFLKSLPNILFFLFIACSAAGQSFFKTTSIGIDGHYGSFLTTAPKAQYVKDSYTYFGEAFFQKQTKENQQWGAGVFYGNTGSRKYIGNMGGVFTYLQLPLLHIKNYTSTLRLAGGVALVEKPYDAVSNHKNVIIGSFVNGYINLFWQNEFKVAQSSFITTGVSFSHLSNGATTLPNMGLNVPAFSIGFRYGAELPAKDLSTPQEFKHNKIIYNFSTSAGIKQIPWIGSKRYLINVLNADAGKRLKRNNTIGAGLQLFYNRSLEVDPATITSNKRDISKFQVGIYSVYEHHLGRVSIPLQLGAMVFNKDINPVIYQQVGIRYNAVGNWYAQLQLKSYGGRADLLHAGIGFAIK